MKVFRATSHVRAIHNQCNPWVDWFALEQKFHVKKIRQLWTEAVRNRLRELGCDDLGCEEVQ